MTKEEALKTYFGYDTFRGGQGRPIRQGVPDGDRRF